MTLREALARATAQLNASPDLRADASRDATVLLLHALAISRAAMLTDPDRSLTAEQATAYEALLLRRLNNEPIQYITGEQEFYGLALKVTPAVLIPRPETEHLVEAVLAELNRDGNSSQALRILDVGTGSGAIAIALAHHLPYAQITAVDISREALEVAAGNALRHQLGNSIHFVHSDLLEAFAPADASFDAIVSNPPYVPTPDREALHPQVRDYEPAVALYGGSAGLDIYRRLVPQARAALKPGGLLALEIGHDQRDSIASLLAGWIDLHFVDDLQRIPRVALARKP
jgi:release factor glutamine methyltransferase